MQAALIAVAWTIGLVAGRKAAVAVALLLLVGWAGGAIIGHLGKLLSLSAWASWPPGPRPKQAALYPRRLWQIEVVLFFVAVEALADGVLIGSAPAVRAGASLLVVAAAAAAAGAGVTFARARRRRPAT